MEDEHTGGQVNSTLQLQREKKEQERLNKLKAAQPVGPQPTTPAKAGDATQQPVRPLNGRVMWMSQEPLQVPWRGISRSLARSQPLNISWTCQMCLISVVQLQTTNCSSQGPQA